jgi:hypothetical protein
LPVAEDLQEFAGQRVAGVAVFSRGAGRVGAEDREHAARWVADCRQHENSGW